MYLFVILLILVICPEICINGATKGLLLWFNTVLPTLFPFFLITKLILFKNLIPKKILPLYPLITGLIAGYPTGAISVSELIKTNRLTSKIGQHLLIAGNNASPGFLIGIAGAFSPHYSRYTIWFCVIAASYIIMLFSFIPTLIKKDIPVNNKLHTDFMDKQPITHTNFLSLLEDTILNCAKLLVLIGGYIIIFSILAEYTGIIITNKAIQGFFAGIFEITCGSTILTQYAAGNELIKGIFLAFICGFGGLSALFQTGAAIRNTGLSLIKYIFHKIICATISGALFAIIYLINNMQ